MMSSQEEKICSFHHMPSVSTASVYEVLDSETEMVTTDCLIATPLPQEDMLFSDLAKEYPVDSTD